MKVYIGPYPERLHCNIHSRYMNKKYGYCQWEDKNQTKYESILEWLEDKIQSFYNIFNRIWFDRREQKIKIKIDPWDTWGLDHTLTLIIIPLLKQLKATKHGSPLVDHKDVPDHLLPSDEEKNLKEWETDSNFHLRWDWVISEMIWTFEQLRDDNWQEQYIKFKDSDNLFNMELEHEDKIGLKKHQERINNGLRLFGKYYINLWD